jgi:diaminopimelate epimerase
MKLSFIKAEGTGNDFIIVDVNALPKTKDLSQLAKSLCQRKKSIGADGLLIYDKSSFCDFKMRIFNPDGSEPEMCGNGIRCIAQYARKIKNLKKNKFSIETKAGQIVIDFLKEDIPRLKLTEAKDLKLNFDLLINGKRMNLNYVVVGVPHVVYLSNGVQDIDVVNVGRKIRFHESFLPAGANVNFVKVTSANSLMVRTYERGVEAETFACGSGVSASSLVAFLLNRVKTPVSVTTSGGKTLTVYIEGTKANIKSLYLEAEARLVFEGKIEI